MKKNSKEGVKPARISPWRKPRSVPRDAWELMERALTASIKENVRARRWRIFFRFVYVFIFIWILVLISLGSRSLNRDVSLVDFTKDEHVALIRMTGIVVDGAVTPLGINAEAMNESLRKAFKNPDAKAVILSINSPGGSPVQAGQIYDEIMRLRRERSDKKVYAVIKELGASAAYYIAAASDEIYCDKSSLVGSIGIISAGFGFDEAMKELGIERRLYTSGQHKGFLDPFLPIDVEEEVFWEGVLGRLHEHFIADVKFGRGARLSRDDEIFSGYIYDGRRALELGLVDGIGTVRSVAKDQVGIEELVDYSPRITSIERWFNTMAQALISRLANTNLY